MIQFKTIARNLRLLFSTDIMQDIEERLNESSDRQEGSITSHCYEHFAELDRRTKDRADKHETAIDERIEARLINVESRVDDRLAKLENRTDERMERHERKIDAMIRQMSDDIVERNDLMLQIFEQRLDKQRREIQSLRESNTTRTNGLYNGQLSMPVHGVKDEPALNGSASQKQLVSFRKLADLSSNIKSKIDPPGKIALYHQILDWKKIAHQGILNFSPDEQEIVDYILSFIDDPHELHYVNQHLRRFISTLQRIPPAQRASDRLLELGSLSHIAPAISKFCGYQHILCADFWDSTDTIDHQTVTQKDGTDSYTFELRNFNVERDPFPYPDAHFRVALCCELIEHLQSDPMHMLWECNRVLEQDGYLILTTPNIASARAIEGLLVGCAPYLMAQYNVRNAADQHNREYAPYEVGVALAAAGFTVLELETEDVWSKSNPAILDLLKQVEMSTDLRGDNIFAIARKSGPTVERFPKELYIN